MSGRLTALCLAAAVAFTACGGDDEPDDATIDEVVAATTTAPPEEPADGPVAEPAEEPAVEPVPTTEPAPAPTAAPELDGPTTFADAAGVPPITTSTPAEGLGPRPLLEWDAVDRAAYYRVVVQADGAAYWAWTGAEPAVTFGGSAPDGPQGQTAQLTDAHAYTWTVSAWSTDDELLGMSAPSTLSP